MASVFTIRGLADFAGELEDKALGIAAGPGLLAKHVAPAAKRVIATDGSDGLIREVKRGERPAHLTFEVAGAAALPLFDVSQDLGMA